MRNGRAGVPELTVALGDPNELFQPSPFDVASGVPPRGPAIDEIRAELSDRSLSVPARLVLEVPASQATPRVKRGIQQAIGRYCDTGIQQVERELRGLRREGWQTLAIGVVVLGLSLLVSDEILSSGAPRGIRDFFGNGLFLVAAWVGMWWPLETLIYSPRPYRLERKLLRAMQAMEILVRPTQPSRPIAPGLTMSPQTPPS